MKNGILVISILMLAATAFGQYPPPDVSDALQKTSRTERTDVAGTLWLDAEDFQDYGGWYHDTQFIYLMGSGYLLAPGLGTPVKDAVATATLSESGAYTLWVRSRNWDPEHSPGIFKVKVGDTFSTLCGNAKSGEWVWQQAGIFPLEAGEQTLRLVDQSGYYGRCDALVLTRDEKFSPPKQEEMAAARAKYTGLELMPVVQGSFDVIVVGGGPAGTSAAIAAARQGAKTALIQDRPVLGGNGSKEFAVGMNGAANQQAQMREGGIINEATLINSFHQTTDFTEAFTELATAEPNLRLFLNTRVDGVIMADQETIQGVKTVHALDGTRSEFHGDYFIDCTGDGWVGYFSGAEFRVGREAKSEFNEKPAPKEADHITMSACVNSEGGPFMVKTENRVSYEPPGWAAKLPVPLHRKIESLAYRHWWMEYPGTVDDVWEGEYARDYLLRIAYGFADYVKNHWEKKETAKNHTLNNIGFFLGRRESRRLMGDYILNLNDVLQPRWFEDSITSYGWSADIHHPQGIFSGKGGPYDCDYRVNPGGGIPFRCIYSKNIPNLLMAGRCISVSHYALGTTRIMMTCATIGQAAGTAAAMCSEYTMTPREVGQERIKELQQRLIKEDQYIPRIQNEDPADLARKAIATASSEQEVWAVNETYHNRPGTVDRGNKAVPLTSRTVMCPAGRLQAVGTLNFLIDNRSAQEAAVTLQLYTSPAFQDFENLTPVTEIPVTIPPDFTGTLPVKVDCELPGRFLVARFKGGAKGVYWEVSHANPPLMCEWSKWEWNQSVHLKTSMVPAFYATPALEWDYDFGAANIINGKTRFWYTNSSVNMWSSDPDQPLPQWVQLAWDQPQTVSEVRLIFDTNLDRRRYKNPIVPERISDYEIQAWLDGGWKTIVSETGNIQRLRIHRIEPVETEKLRVVASKTGGDPSARIYELRVY